MIKINLISERKQTKAKARTPSVVSTGGMGGGRTFALAAVLVLGVFASAGWWWSLSNQVTEWQTKIADADRELKRLEDVRKKGDQYEAQKALLARKIELITELKKQQAVPVHILDQISQNLPEFLWLDSMSANNNKINIAGKATTYTAVSNFYSNLSGSGFFQEVTLGKTFEVPEGVSFSLTCQFAGETLPADQEPQG